MRKPFIGVSSSAIPDKHQVELLEKLASEKLILWCRDLKKLKEYIQIARNTDFKIYEKPSYEIDKVIFDFLQKPELVHHNLRRKL